MSKARTTKDIMPALFRVANWSAIWRPSEYELDAIVGVCEGVEITIRRHIDGWMLKVRITAKHGGATVPLFDSEPDEWIKALWRELGEEIYRREQRTRESAANEVFKAIGVK